MLHTKCLSCGKKRQKLAYGEGYRQGKCWDVGYCAYCITKQSKDFCRLYRDDGYHTRLYKVKNGVIKRRGERDNFNAPRESRTLPSLIAINKASGDKLVRLLNRKIEEIYG